MDRSPLHSASSGEEARLLLDNDADVNARDRYNKPPLHKAAIFNKADVALVLIQQGAEVDAKTNCGSTPLHLARSGEVARLLLDNGADVNARGGYDLTPLHHAAILEKADVALVLIKQGAEVDAKNNRGRTPLHFARSAKVARLLLDNGADVNARNRYNKTPLHKAAIFNKADVALVLIQQGAEVDAKTNCGSTPLHLARSGEVARLLLDNGADVNARGGYDLTPLHHAAILEKADVALVLIKQGAEVDAKHDDGKTPLHLARSGEVARLLLDNGADVNARNRYNHTPLHHASESGRADVVSLLLRHGAQVEAKNHTGKTPLHYAGSGEVARLLLDNEADVNAADLYKSTPLHEAAKAGRVDVASVLIRHGADVNKCDNWFGYNRTPLQDARSKDFVVMLLENGADISLQNGRTALDKAIDKQDYAKAGLILASIALRTASLEVNGDNLNKLWPGIRSVQRYHGKSVEQIQRMCHAELAQLKRRRLAGTWTWYDVLQSRIARPSPSENLLAALDTFDKDAFPLYGQLISQNSRRVKRKLCHAELAQLKRRRLAGTWTWYDVLQRRITRHPPSENLLAALDTFDKDAFPLYGQLILEISRREKPKFELISECRKCLVELSILHNDSGQAAMTWLPEELQRRILSCLDEVDLQKLISSLRDMKHQMTTCSEQPKEQ